MAKFVVRVNDRVVQLGVASYNRIFGKKNVDKGIFYAVVDAENEKQAVEEFCKKKNLNPSLFLARPMTKKDKVPVEGYGDDKKTPSPHFKGESSYTSCLRRRGYVVEAEAKDKWLELMDHWCNETDKALVNIRGNSTGRKLERIYLGSNAIESAYAAYMNFSKWRGSFDLFRDSLDELDSMFRAEYRSGFYNVKGAGKIRDSVEHVNGLVGESIFYDLLPPVSNTKFIANEIEKNGSRKKVEELISDIGSTRRHGIRGIEEKGMLLRSVNRGLSTICAKLKDDGYDDPPDKLWNKSQETFDFYKRSVSLFANFMKSMSEATERASRYQADLASGLF